MRCGINTVTVINNNRSLNQDRAGVDRAYGDQSDGHREEMWVFNGVNFAAIAQNMGALGIRVEKPDQLAPALEKALAAGRPAVVDVSTDMDAMAPPARTPS